MAAIRYEVTPQPASHSGWPAGQNGHAALMPSFTRWAASGAQEYKGAVTGQPGTRGIPVEPVIPSPDQGDIAQMGLSRSSDAANVFFPNLYYTSGGIRERPGAGMPVSVYSDNLMPVPAVDPRGIPSTLYVPVADKRGQRQIQATPNLPRWANYGGS